MKSFAPFSALPSGTFPIVIDQIGYQGLQYSHTIVFRHDEGRGRRITINNIFSLLSSYEEHKTIN
ncbi:hypothetical protein O9G_003697 [Rozella allomycis CSF55]|uniref:Uncharacterized protein n=1 Tax=Rozella allomycis (strain CSF55) TaxID=988480 RepID=A0A075ARQ9_ROZAC|nr:hypothetical protein O9G_003697 [Rozella allomycis CSF55]|eukprot:EPZ32966.1 hypothetical protein O9G_003697 [Rozella allomycis CSF55]